MKREERLSVINDMTRKEEILMASNKRLIWHFVVFTALALAFLWGSLPSTAHAFTVNVVDQNGIPVSGFKWLLEEDNTHPPEPGDHKPVAADVRDNTLSISIHNSHAPVVASGVSETSSATINTITYPGGTAPLLPGRYFESVYKLPFFAA